MASRQKEKGKSYERVVAKMLGEAFGMNFERVPASGAFTGGLNSFRADRLTAEQLLLSDGDIIVPKELAHICIECKSYKDLSFSGLYTGKNAQIDKWIAQASANKKRYWFLLIKIAHQGQFVCFDVATGDTIGASALPNVMRYQGKYIIAPEEGFFKQFKDQILNLPTLQ